MAKKNNDDLLDTELDEQEEKKEHMEQHLLPRVLRAGGPGAGGVQIPHPADAPGGALRHHGPGHAALAGLDVLHLRGPRIPLDGHFPAGHLHLQPAGGPRLFPGPAHGRERLQS